MLHWESTITGCVFSVACKSRGWLKITPKRCQAAPLTRLMKGSESGLGAEYKLKPDATVASSHILQAATLTWFRTCVFPERLYVKGRLLSTGKTTGSDEETTQLAVWCLEDVHFNHMPINEQINVPIKNTGNWFSCWSLSWIQLKRDGGWPFQWPLSMKPCLEHDLLNDLCVRGWSGQPCLTFQCIGPWGHLASFEIMCQKAASIWQIFSQ